MVKAHLRSHGVHWQGQTNTFEEKDFPQLAFPSLVSANECTVVRRGHILHGIECSLVTFDAVLLFFAIHIRAKTNILNHFESNLF